MRKFDLYGVTSQFVIVGMNIKRTLREKFDGVEFTDYITEVSDNASNHGKFYHSRYWVIITKYEGEFTDFLVFKNLEEAKKHANKSAKEEKDTLMTKLKAVNYSLKTLKDISDSDL